MSTWRGLALAASVCVWLVCSVALGQQTSNYVFRAVPAPGTVTVDGKLDDWDLSGQILICYDLQKLAETHSVRAAAMYDATNLYLAFHFKDRTPMVNHIDPASHPGDGWKADSVQVRMKLDRVLHVTAWY